MRLPELVLAADWPGKAVFHREGESYNAENGVTDDGTRQPAANCELENGRRSSGPTFADTVIILKRSPLRAARLHTPRGGVLRPRSFSIPRTGTYLFRVHVRARARADVHRVAFLQRAHVTGIAYSEELGRSARF